MTGCLTCKIRKVKCDEARPSCLRCSSTGRKCDGYPDSMRAYTPDRKVFPIRGVAIYGDVNAAEIRSFEFFVQRVMPGFTPIVDDRFWHQLIPQFSHSDPEIWNAVNSMSMLIHELQYRQHGTTNKRDAGGHQLALRWYNKSITGLQSRIKRELTWSATCNITCILYICIECLQSNFGEAKVIYTRAISMLSTPWDRPQSSEELVVSEIVQALLRHMSASQGALGLPLATPAKYLEFGFPTLKDATHELYRLIAESHQFVCEVEIIKLRQEKDWQPTFDMVQRRNSIQADLMKLYCAVSATSWDPASSADAELHAVLHLTYSQIFISVATALTLYETAYDAFFSVFDHMIDHARRAIEATPVVQPIFQFETRVLQTLFFIATKCRHPVIRRRAIALMRRGPKMENFVEADIQILVSERSVGIEESGSEDGVFKPDAPCHVPDEASRIYSRLWHEGNKLKIGWWRQDILGRWYKVDHEVQL